ncbi:PhnD/SsuA/transferrin family substrate-binding protein [Dasania marina]|uniref:PhnD/SsuA/transferrin family substrate-binding protein n=1 Tax=Dasania marina TaxID=471499 RepID=UPI00036ADC21|nr:PhnD/SsuA/transferrin family substrate-binding protein [Dasania marina]
MKQAVSSLTLTLLLLSLGMATQAAIPAMPATIEFHVYPLYSAKLRQVWASGYQQQLASEAGIKTQFKTANSLAEFIHNTQSPSHKLVASPLHVALYLQKTYGYTLLMQQIYSTEWVLISKKSTAFNGPDSLNGQCLAVPDQLDALSIAALAEINLLKKSQTQFQVIDKTTQDQSLFAVAKGECAFAIVADLVVEKALRSSLQNIKYDMRGGKKSMSLVFSLSPQTPAALQQVIQQSLLEIGHGPKQNSNFLSPPAQTISSQGDDIQANNTTLNALDVIEQQLDAKKL